MLWLAVECLLLIGSSKRRRLLDEEIGGRVEPIVEFISKLEDLEDLEGINAEEAEEEDDLYGDVCEPTFSEGGVTGLLTGAIVSPREEFPAFIFST